MTAPPDVRLIQVARILGLTASELTTGIARAAIAARPGDVASALFAEAADSDDVTGVESGRDYLEGRLAFLGDLIGPAAAAAIRAAFEEHLRAWD